MPAPKSLAGLVASVEVRTTDLYAALKAVQPHTAPKDDLPLLAAVHVAVRADGNAYVMATDRYTLGLAVVSIWDDHLKTGEEVDVDLSPEDVGDILHLFRPGKDDHPEACLRLDVSAAEVHVTEVAGMIETEADKHVGLPRQVFTDPYPRLPQMIAGSIRTAVALRERAEVAGAAGEAALAELFANAPMLARFAAAQKAYRSPLVIQRTAEARGALLIGCGESFVGLFMPIAAREEDVAEYRGWQAAWLRRLPEPDEAPVEMPDTTAKAAPADGEADAAEAGPGQQEMPEYMPAPDDGHVLPGDRLVCLKDGCDWWRETSLVDSDTSLSDAMHHVISAHGVGVDDWRETMPFVGAERLSKYRDLPASEVAELADQAAQLAEAVNAGVSADLVDALADMAAAGDGGITIETRFADLPGRVTPPDVSVTFSGDDVPALRKLSADLKS